MTAAQLIAALQTMPPQAVVLFEGDSGYDAISAVTLLTNDNGMPDEVILHPDMTPD